MPSLCNNSFKKVGRSKSNKLIHRYAIIKFTKSVKESMRNAKRICIRWISWCHAKSKQYLWSFRKTLQAKFNQASIKNLNHLKKRLLTWARNLIL